MLRPILRDILQLHDIVEFGSLKWTGRLGQKAGVRFPFIEERKRGLYKAVFTDETSKQRLFGGALFPILGSFRWLVELNGKEAHWRGGFERVLQIWEKVGPEMMRSTLETSEELGRRPYAIGRSRNHWSALHKTVGLAERRVQRQIEKATNMTKEDITELRSGKNRRGSHLAS